MITQRDFNFDELVPSPSTVEDLIKDPDFIQNAWTWYNSAHVANDAKDTRRGSGQMGRKNRATAPVDDEQVADWAINAASAFNWNMTKMVIDWNKMRNQPVKNIKAMMSVIEAYDAVPSTPETLARGVGHLATDPLSYLGFSLLAKSAVSQTTKAGIKSYIKNVVSKKMSNPAVVASTEGALYGLAAGHVDEDLTSKKEQRDYNAVTPMIYAGVGATAGYGLVRGGQMLVGIPQRFNVLRGGADEGATYTDSGQTAKHYGDVNKKHIEAYNPFIFDSENLEVSELVNDLYLDEAEEKILRNLAGSKSKGQQLTADPLDDAESKVQNAINDQIAQKEAKGGYYDIKVAELMRAPEVQDIMSKRGVDLVAYPEKTEFTGEASPERLAEYEADTSSLTPDGVSMTYRQLGDFSDMESE